MYEALSYDDVLLVPQHSTVTSRSEVNIGNELDGDMFLSLPIISSPMDTVTEEDMVVAMAEAGGMGVIHRYNSIEEQEAIAIKAFSKLAHNLSNPAPIPPTGAPMIGAAVGVTDDYLLRTKRLLDCGVSVICVDVAHGHHLLAERALKTLRDAYGDIFHLMAGNVATIEGFNALSDWGADSVRVGVGGGSICSTRIQTGHGVPSFASILDCSETDRSTAIIADGGIKNSGDIVKALAAGADFVMVGSLLAGTDEAPGQLFDAPKGKKYKSYRGMASKDAQMEWRGKTATPEGISTTIPYRGSVSDILDDLRGGITSGFSYSGANNMSELWSKARFVQQTAAGQKESSTHILNR